MKGVMGRLIVLGWVWLAGCVTPSALGPERSAPVPSTLLEAIEAAHPPGDGFVEGRIPMSLAEAMGASLGRIEGMSTDAPWVDFKVITWPEAWEALLQGTFIGDVHGPGSNPRAGLPCANPVWASPNRPLAHPLQPRNVRIILVGGDDEFDLVMEVAERFKRLGYTRVELVEEGYETWKKSIGHSLTSTVYCFNSAG